MCIHNEIEDQMMHERLHDNLVEYLWACHGVSETIKMPKRGVNWTNSKFLAKIKSYT